MIKRHSKILISWDPVFSADVSVYNNAGERIRLLAKNSATNFVWWNLKNSAGTALANGIYLIHARVSGQRRGAIFKLAIGR